MNCVYKFRSGAMLFRMILWAVLIEYFCAVIIFMSRCAYELRFHEIFMGLLSLSRCVCLYASDSVFSQENAFHLWDSQCSHNAKIMCTT